jgi:alpha-maltose-1-phosphate synthase
MKIAIASIGRFYMFDLARQMMRLNQQAKLYTGYPNLKVDADLRRIAESHWFWTVAANLRYRIKPLPTTTWWYYHAHEEFDGWLARNLEDVDIMDALSGVGLKTGRMLAQRGKPWICNRGSSHILAQRQILEDEHRLWKLPPPYFDRGIHIQRALNEYDEADAVVVPSSWNKETFIQHGISADKVHVIPYGVDLSLFHPLPKEDKRFRILFVGTFSARKGIGYLLEAVRPFVEQNLAEVWLIGGPDETAKPIMERYANIFIDKGFIPRKDLAWYYSQGSVLVLPSVEEGLALVQAQAMACGLPVIATTNTGAQDLFTDGQEGFIVPIRSPEAIRERLQWFLDNPLEREAMAAAAVQRVNRIGGWNEYGQRCLTMYQEVIEKKEKS